MLASKHTRVEIPSKSIPTFRKDLHFLASSHSIHEKVFPAKYYKGGKRPRKSFSISFWNKKNWTKIFSTTQFFPRALNNRTPKQRSSGNLAFAFSTLFEYENQVLKNSLNTVATKESCCSFNQWIIWWNYDDDVWY